MASAPAKVLETVKVLAAMIMEVVVKEMEYVTDRWNAKD